MGQKEKVTVWVKWPGGFVRTTAEFWESDAAIVRACRLKHPLIPADCVVEREFRP